MECAFEAIRKLPGVSSLHHYTADHEYEFSTANKHGVLRKIVMYQGKFGEFWLIDVVGFKMFEFF